MSYREFDHITGTWLSVPQDDYDPISERGYVCDSPPSYDKSPILSDDEDDRWTEDERWTGYATDPYIPDWGRHRGRSVGRINFRDTEMPLSIYEPPIPRYVWRPLLSDYIREPDLLTSQRPTEAVCLSLASEMSLLLRFLSDPSLEVQTASVTHFPMAVQFLDDPDETIITLALVGSEMAIGVVEQTWDRVKTAVIHHPSAIKWVTLPKTDPEWVDLVRCAIAREPDLVSEIAVEDVTDEMMVGLAIRHHPTRQTEAICLAAVQVNPQALHHVVDQTVAIVKEALQRDPQLLKIVRTDLVPLVCDDAIALDGTVIKHLDVSLVTHSRCIRAVQQQGQALRYITQPPLDVIKAAVDNDETSIEHTGIAVPSHPSQERGYRRILKVIRSVIDSDGNMIYYVPEESLRPCDYHALVLAAVAQSSRAAKYIKMTKDTLQYNPVTRISTRKREIHEELVLAMIVVDPNVIEYLTTKSVPCIELAITLDHNVAAHCPGWIDKEMIISLVDKAFGAVTDKMDEYQIYDAFFVAYPEIGRWLMYNHHSTTACHVAINHGYVKQVLTASKSLRYLDLCLHAIGMSCRWIKYCRLGDYVWSDRIYLEQICSYAYCLDPDTAEWIPRSVFRTMKISTNSQS